MDNITTILHSKGSRKGKNYHYNLRGGLDYMLTERTTLNLGLEVAYNKFTRDGNLDYFESKTNTGTLVEKAEYDSRDEYDLHSTANRGDVGFKHKFGNDGHQLLGGFLLVYEGDALEYFQSDLFDKNNQHQQGYKAWEDEIRWTVRGNVDYTLPYSKTGKLEGGYQYFSYLEDGDYSMQLGNPCFELV